MVQQSSGATGTEIAEKIFELYKTKNLDMDFKNVQRRVYDALNVLHALNVIRKDKNRIVYLGLKGEQGFSSQISFCSSRRSLDKNNQENLDTKIFDWQNPDS